MHLLLLEYMVSKREARDGVGDVRRAEMCVMAGWCISNIVQNKMKSN